MAVKKSLVLNTTGVLEQLQSGDLDSSALMPWSTQTANYTLALADANTAVNMNMASAGTVTIPPHSSVALDNNVAVVIRQKGAGQITIVAGAGVTVAPVGVVTKGQDTVVVLFQESQDVWFVSTGNAGVNVNTGIGLQLMISRGNYNL